MDASKKRDDYSKMVEKYELKLRLLRRDLLSRVWELASDRDIDLGFEDYEEFEEFINRQDW